MPPARGMRLPSNRSFQELMASSSETNLEGDMV